MKENNEKEIFPDENEAGKQLSELELLAIAIKNLVYLKNF